MGDKPLKKVKVTVPAGIITIEQLTGITDLAKEKGGIAAKFTVRDGLMVLLPEENAPAFLEGAKRLGFIHQIAPVSVRYVRSCGGGHPQFCQRNKANAYELTKKITEKFVNMVDLPNKFKIAVCGCSNCCTNIQYADFGAMGVDKDAFNVYIGGLGGTVNPVRAAFYKQGVSSDGVIQTIEYILGKYKELAKPGERLSAAIARVGLASFS